MTATSRFLIAFGLVGLVALLLCGCDRSPSEEDMAQGCASHRSPTWNDLIECKSARRGDAK